MDDELAITDQLTAADEAELSRDNDFTQWKAIFSKLNPLQLATMAERALQTNAPARHSLHFWNAVIDGLVMSSHMAIHMTDERRVAGLAMAESYKKIVRGIVQRNPGLAMQIERAWAGSGGRAAKYGEPEVRLELFKAGAINEWGFNREG